MPRRISQNISCMEFDFWEKSSSMGLKNVLVEIAKYNMLLHFPTTQGEFALQTGDVDTIL